MSRLLQRCCAVMIVALTPWLILEASAQPKSAPVVLRVAYIPIANYAALLVARDKGYFAGENLSVTWSPVAQGAVAVEAVFDGSAEIGGSAIFETMVARGNGLDVMFLAGATHIRSEPPDNALLVRTEDAIRSPGAMSAARRRKGVMTICAVSTSHHARW